MTTGGHYAGSYSRFGLGYSAIAAGSRNQCIDLPGPGLGDGLPFDTYHYTGEGGIINSAYNPGINGRYPLDWPIQAMQEERYRSHIPSGAPNDVYFATLGQRLTNPSAPTVDLPVFVAEMREIPSLLAIHGRDLIRKSTSANLALQFGWKPLLSDLASMINIAEFANRRAKRLTKLRDTGSLRSTLSLGTYVNTQTKKETVESFVNTLTRNIRRETVERVSAYVCWTPDGDFPMTEREMIALARRATVGLTADAATAWELIPWSWFADYFSNVGSFLMANRNIVRASVNGPIQIMRHQITVTTDPDSPPVWSGEPWMLYKQPIKAVHETKSRRQAVASITAHLPFLNETQVSILGSLALSRLGK